jgi:hypothetical protein
MLKQLREAKKKEKKRLSNQAYRQSKKSSSDSMDASVGKRRKHTAKNIEAIKKLKVFAQYFKK